MIKEINESNFEKEVTNAGYVLVDFYATWCGPCKMMSLVIDEIAKDSTVKICKCDVDKAQSIALRYQVSSIPTLILFKNGEDIATSQGYIPKEKLLEFIEANKK